MSAVSVVEKSVIMWGHLVKLQMAHKERIWSARENVTLTGFDVGDIQTADDHQLFVHPKQERKKLRLCPQSPKWQDFVW